jgi:hypothetical protein
MYHETQEWAYYPNNDSAATLQLFMKQSDKFLPEPPRYVRDLTSGNFYELSQVFGRPPNIYAPDRTGSVIEIKPTRVAARNSNLQSQGVNPSLSI